MRNNNVNNLIIKTIIIDGLDEEIRCTMCRNPMKSDRGCDGGCKYDEKLYEDIINILKERISSNQNACDGCKYLPRFCNEEPCVSCSNNYENKWRKENR